MKPKKQSQQICGFSPARANESVVYRGSERNTPPLECRVTRKPPPVPPLSVDTTPPRQRGVSSAEGKGAPAAGTQLEPAGWGTPHQLIIAKTHGASIKVVLLKTVLDG